MWFSDDEAYLHACSLSSVNCLDHSSHEILCILYKHHISLENVYTKMMSYLITIHVYYFASGPRIR